MGKIKQGILGGFSGKVGPVVGSSWKGKAYMRTRALSVSNPNTPAQQHQRACFKLVGKFISKVLEAVKVGFKHVAVGESEANSATRVNLAEAVQGTGTLVNLDWTKVVLSKGSLPNPSTPTATAQEGHTIDLAWGDNTGVTREALATDLIMVVLYNSDKKTALFSDEKDRQATSVSIGHSADWAGDSVQVYLFAHSLDGKLNADSIRVGEVTAQ